MMIPITDQRVIHQLQTKGRVYTLLSKNHILTEKEKLGKGEAYLTYGETEAPREIVRFYFLKTVKENKWGKTLQEYLPQSGFSSLEEWKESAGKDKHLFLFKLKGFRLGKRMI